MATSATQIAKTGKYGDLRRRLVFLLLALVVYRIGAHIPVPGINPDQLRQLFEGQQGGILNLFNMFSGGALSRFPVFALGIMPSIPASIILQPLPYVLPMFEQLGQHLAAVGIGHDGAHRHAQHDVVARGSELIGPATRLAVARLVPALSLIHISEPTRPY